MFPNNPSRRASLAAVVLVAVLAAPLGAQGVDAEPTVWVTYAGEHPVAGGGTALILDSHVRRADGFAEWRQLLLRAGLSRGVGAHVRVSGGWAYLRTFANEEAGTPFAVWDHRAWQMVQLTHGLGRVTLVHRGRLEQRFFRADAASGVPDWLFAWRTRYQLRGTVPLGGAAARVYALASQEVFVPFGPHEGRPAIDQSRTGVGLGARLSPTLRAEVGYLNRAAVADGRARTRDHALQLSFASSAPMMAGRRPTP